MISLTEENYLKALYRLAQQNPEITVKDIAESLNIKMPTVNSMVKKLDEKKFIRYEKYKAIELTEKRRETGFIYPTQAPAYGIVPFAGNGDGMGRGT